MDRNNKGQFISSQANRQEKKTWALSNNVIPPSRMGIKHKKGTKMKMSISRKGFNLGQKHYRWNPDREAVRRDLRNDPVYKQWSRSVKNRDHWKCKINNEDCNGKVVAHHILSWAKFPELRYEVNNGITLCHAHHPTKRAEEVRLAPVFQGMLSQIAN